MIEVKKCDNCGKDNDVSSTECVYCGYDLTFVFPTKKNETENVENEINSSDGDLEKSATRYSLIVKNGEEQIIVSEEISVGRDCDYLNELFNKSNYTSRTHAKLRIENGKLQVMDASTNGTFIDDRRIKKLEWFDVPECSTLRFADIEFIIRRA